MPPAWFLGVGQEAGALVLARERDHSLPVHAMAQRHSVDRDQERMLLRGPSSKGGWAFRLWVRSRPGARDPTTRRVAMRFMMFMIPAVYQQNVPADFRPDPAAIEQMGKYNDTLHRAGVLLSLDGLHPPV